LYRVQINKRHTDFRYRTVNDLSVRAKVFMARRQRCFAHRPGAVDFGFQSRPMRSTFSPDQSSFRLHNKTFTPFWASMNIKLKADGDPRTK
jgi:hypothetical protein